VKSAKISAARGRRWLERFRRFWNPHLDAGGGGTNDRVLPRRGSGRGPGAPRI